MSFHLPARLRTARKVRKETVQLWRGQNRAFLKSLDFYQRDGIYDWVQEAAGSYPDCFRDEMLEILDGKQVDPIFVELERKLRGMGIHISRPTCGLPKNIDYATGAAPLGAK